MLCIGAVIVLHEDDLHHAVHSRIAVDEIGHAVYIMNNCFCTAVARRSFCTEDECGGRKVLDAAVLDRQIQIHDAQRIEQLALILMQALDLHVKDKRWVKCNALMLLDHAAQLAFLLKLDGVELLDGHFVNTSLQSFQLVEMFQISCADLAVEQTAEFRVRQAQPAAGRNAVGLVLEALGVDGIPVFEQIVLENLRVNLGNAVDTGGHIDRQIRHMRLPILDDKERCMRVLLLEFGIDTLDNLADLRHNRTQQFQIPFFKRLCHDSVVRIGKHAAGQFKRGIKVQSFGHQQTDQFRDGHGWMRIVQLNSDELRQTVIIRAVLLAIVAQNVLQRCAGENILLLDAQTLALPCGIVRIQNAGNILGLVLLFKRLDIVLRVKGIEVQFFLSFALPEAERADRRCLIADDRHIIRDAVDSLVSKFDLDSQLVTAVTPRVAVFGPVVRVFTLAAVYKRLLEQAEAVAQAIAGQRQIERRGAVKKAGGQTAKAAIPECCVLNMLQTRKIDAFFGKGRFHFTQNAKIEKVAVDQTPNKILRRKIERAAARRLTALSLRPVVADLHHNDLPKRLMQPLWGCFLQRLVMLEMQQRFRLFYDSFRKFAHRLLLPWDPAVQTAGGFYRSIHLSGKDRWTPDNSMVLYTI